MEYNRANAVAYAKKWAYGRNPKYYDFSDLGGDCTNFASQCIYAGSGVMNYTPTYGWYYISVNNRAPAWTGVDELYRFLTTNRGAGPRAILPIYHKFKTATLFSCNLPTKKDLTILRLWLTQETEHRSQFLLRHIRMMRIADHCRHTDI